MRRCTLVRVLRYLAVVLRCLEGTAGVVQSVTIMHCGIIATHLSNTCRAALWDLLSLGSSGTPLALAALFTWEEEGGSRDKWLWQGAEVCRLGIAPQREGA